MVPGGVLRVFHGSRLFFKVPVRFSMALGAFFMVFQGSKLVFHDYRWNFMVIYGSRLFCGHHGSISVFHDSRLVFMVFHCSRLV